MSLFGPEPAPPPDIRVLSLLQPWASLLCDPTLPKTIETRGQPWPATIPLHPAGAWVLVHASAAAPLGADLKRLIADRPEVWNAWYAAGLVSEDGSLDCIPLGAVLGAVHVTASLPVVPADTEESYRLSKVDGARYLCDPGPIWTTESGSEFGGLRILRTYQTETGWATEIDSGGPGPGYEADRPFGGYDTTDGPRWAYLTDEQILLPEPIPYSNGLGWRRPKDGLLEAVAAASPLLAERLTLAA